MTKAPQWTFGRFVWHELSTPDMARSQAFYSELLGWKYQSFSGGSDPYHLILVDGAPLGGLVAGDTTQLMAYVSVPDVDAAAAATAGGGGGTVLVHPLEVPGVGRLAVLADAGGAAFSILHNSGGDAPDRPLRTGQFAWHQLECSADATHAAAGFYAAVLGWSISAGGGNGAPIVFRAGDRPCAGLSPSPAASAAAGWATWRWTTFQLLASAPSAWAARCWPNSARRQRTHRRPGHRQPGHGVRSDGDLPASCEISEQRRLLLLGQRGLDDERRAGRTPAPRACAAHGELQVLHRGDLLLAHLGLVVAGPHQRAVIATQIQVLGQLPPLAQQPIPLVLVVDLHQQAATQLAVVAQHGVVGVDLLLDVGLAHDALDPRHLLDLVADGVGVLEQEGQIRRPRARAAGA